MKSVGVGGGRLGLMQPSEACWELCRGGGVVAVRLERGVIGGLGLSGGMAFWAGTGPAKPTDTETQQPNTNSC